ncbi:hypothetical protein Tco_0287671 [Tanacetum coccineum]
MIVSCTTIPLSESTPPVLVPILHRTTRKLARSFHMRCASAALSVWQRWQLCAESALPEDDEIEERMDLPIVRRNQRTMVLTSRRMIDPLRRMRSYYSGGRRASEWIDEGYGCRCESRVKTTRVIEGRKASPVVGTTVSAPLGLGYRALRRRELALEEGDVYTTFEVGQDSGSAPESKRPERMSAFRQPTLTTWIDLEDGMIYIDIPDYPPPAPPVQTPPLPEWTSGSLPISPSPSDDPSPMIPLTVPSPVATPAVVETGGFLTELGAQVQMQGGLISDHAVRLEELSPALFERYGRDIGELFTRSGAPLRLGQVRQMPREKQCPENKHSGWHAISDVQGENRNLRLQLAEDRRA